MTDVMVRLVGCPAVVVEGVVVGETVFTFTDGGLAFTSGGFDNGAGIPPCVYKKKEREMRKKEVNTGR